MNRKQKVYNLLKAIETGEPEAIKVVNESKYIQHNPQTEEGVEGLAVLFARLAKTDPKVTIARLFEDGDFVFGHTIYDFANIRIGFEVFRFEGDFIVEHWDNIQLRQGDMIGGTVESRSKELSEANRSHIKNFIKTVAIHRDLTAWDSFVDDTRFVEHSVVQKLKTKVTNYRYFKNHKVLVEGDFVLATNQGTIDDVESSFYDLFRVDGGKIVEHWETTETVPPKDSWKNSNGKF